MGNVYKIEWSLGVRYMVLIFKIFILLKNFSFSVIGRCGEMYFVSFKSICLSVTIHNNLK